MRGRPTHQSAARRSTRSRFCGSARAPSASPRSFRGWGARSSCRAPAVSEKGRPSPVGGALPTFARQDSRPSRPSWGAGARRRGGGRGPRGYRGGGGLRPRAKEPPGAGTEAWDAVPAASGGNAAPPRTPLRRQVSRTPGPQPPAVVPAVAPAPQREREGPAARYGPPEPVDGS